MLDINPVAAGVANYTPPATNIQTASNIDDRRYTKFDRTDIDTGSTTMSFGDFLDMVNPLQHIPVLSSAYRAVTGDQINPVSRVAGDILYGAITGGASAILSGAGAIADAAMEASTGKDVGGYMLASLFGSDSGSGKDNAVQLANAAPPAAATPAAVEVADAGKTKAAAQVSAGAARNGDAATPFATTGKAFSLAGVNRKPYGGVMAPVGGLDPHLAMALASASPTVHLGHTIYTGKFMNGPKPMPVGAIPSVPAPAGMASAPTAAIGGAQAPTAQANAGATAALASPLSAASAASAAVAIPGTAASSYPPGLMQEMMMKSLNQYRGVEAGLSTPTPGGQLNSLN